MRILLVTQWYPPDPNRNIGEMAETLQQLGHQITVLTAIPNYPTERFYPGYRFRLWQREVVNGVPVVRVPLYPSHSKSAIKRGLNFLSFAFFLGVIGPWVVPRVDVVYFFHPPITVGVPAWLLSRLQHVPLAMEIQDLWPETFAAVGMSPDARIPRLLGALCNWVYRRTSAIRVISEGFRQNLILKGVPDDRIHIISNWADVACFTGAKPDADFIKAHETDRKFTVMYAGSLGEPQQLSTVVRAAELIQDLKDCQILLVGAGAEADLLHEQTRTKGLSNLHVISNSDHISGRFAPEQMPSIQACADVLLVHLKEDPLFRLTVPHKIFACMASEKPILGAIAGDGARIIEDACAGLTCAPSNPRKWLPLFASLGGCPRSSGLRWVETGDASLNVNSIWRSVLARLEQCWKERSMPPAVDKASLLSTLRAWALQVYS